MRTVQSIVSHLIPEHCSFAIISICSVSTGAHSSRSCRYPSAILRRGLDFGGRDTPATTVLTQCRSGPTNRGEFQFNRDAPGGSPISCTLGEAVAVKQRSKSRSPRGLKGSKQSARPECTASHILDVPSTPNPPHCQRHGRRLPNVLGDAVHVEDLLRTSSRSCRASCVNSRGTVPNQ